MQQAELIIAYLKGELSGSQRQEFEERLTSDQALQLAVQQYQLILEGFKGMKHHAFEGEVSKWDVEDELDEDGLLILNYLNGNLSDSQQSDLEQRLETDAALAQRLAAYRPMMEGFKGLRQEKFLEDVQEWAKELPGANTSSEAKVVSLTGRKPRWRIYSAAAAVLALLAIAFWLFAPGGSSTDYTAFRQESYIAPASDALERGNEEILSQAVRDFTTKQYAQAIESLQRIPTEDSLFVTAQYLLGHSQYQLGQYQSAITSFTKSLEPPSSMTYYLRGFNRDNAAWTRILAQMALMSEVSNASPQERAMLRTYLSSFLQSADPSDTYFTKAQALEALLNE